MAVGSYITTPRNAPDYVISQKDDTVYALDTRGATALSGTDASEVINKALSAGNYVFIKSGTYNLTASLKVYSHTILEGEGVDDPVLGKNDTATRLSRSPSLNGSVITGKNVYNIVIKNLAVDGTRNDSTPIAGCDGLHFDVIKRSRLEGLSVYNCMGEGICLTGSGSIENRMIYCSVRHNNMNGILQQLQSDSTVSYCELGGNGYDGLRMYTAGNNLVEGCTIFLNKGCGIRLTDAQQNRIVANRVNTNVADGIRVAVQTENCCDRNIISQNVIYDNGYKGAGGASGVVLVGGNQTAIKNCAVSNNEVFNTKDWGKPQSFGIREIGVNEANMILGNSCTENISVNIKTAGATTKCSDCWNGTTYIK